MVLLSKTNWGCVLRLIAAESCRPFCCDMSHCQQAKGATEFWGKELYALEERSILPSSFVCGLLLFPPREKLGAREVNYRHLPERVPFNMLVSIDFSHQLGCGGPLELLVSLGTPDLWILDLEIFSALQPFGVEL
uniref:Uncharacterized protein n=1 Tax=Physcomitrium patens TaxID=3218 RepID=A0A2K1K310_PHYPA|nr:hypothetical protein PHYPA_012633 [Physcomitrium patens]